MKTLNALADLPFSSKRSRAGREMAPDALVSHKVGWLARRAVLQPIRTDR